MWNIEIPRDGHSRPLFSSAATRSIYSTQPKSNIQIFLVYAVVRPYSCLWVDGRSVKAKPVCIWVKRINSLLPHRAFKTRKRHDREITTINNKPTDERNVHKTAIGRDRGQKPSKSTIYTKNPFWISWVAVSKTTDQKYLKYASKIRPSSLDKLSVLFFDRCCAVYCLPWLCAPCLRAPKHSQCYLEMKSVYNEVGRWARRSRLNQIRWRR